ncbi:MAG: hypothetical protein V1933_03715 [Candidatus Omnitrophota bacterium]
MKESIIPIVTALGFGGIIGAYFQAIFQRQSQIKEKEHELKSRRYKTILILMLIKLDPKNGMQHIAEFRDDLKNITDVEKEIETELLNAVLFADDEVIKNLAKFSQNPCKATYIKTVVAMRKELWGKKTKIKEEWLEKIAIGNKTT